MSNKNPMKSYQSLLNEREAILDETEAWKQGRSVYSENQRMGLWSNSTYLDELLYIRQTIEKEMILYEIDFRKRFYKNIGKKLPDELIRHISSFGDYIDKSSTI